MKVTIVSRIFLPEPSAASIALGALAVRLYEQGHEVEVITSAPPRGLTTMSLEGIQVRRAPVLRDRTGYVRGYLQYLSFDIPLALRLLLRRRPDVYFVEPPPTTGAVVRVIAALQRRPYVYDAADIWSDAVTLHSGAKLVPSLLALLERFAYSGASALAAVSSGVKNRLEELGWTSRATVAGFGADTRTFRYQAEAGAPLPEFIYAGTFSKWHGAGILIEALALLRHRHPDARIAFYGNGTELDSLQERAVTLGVADAVSWHPPISPDELRDVFARAAGSLASQFPGDTYQYGFATKIYSALATGCPVIFAGNGPTGDFMGSVARDGVALGAVVGYDAAEIADAMAAMLTDPLTAEDRKALAAWTAREHSLDAVADRVIELLARSVR